MAMSLREMTDAVCSFMTLDEAIAWCDRVNFDVTYRDENGNRATAEMRTEARRVVAIVAAREAR